MYHLSRLIAHPLLPALSVVLLVLPAMGQEDKDREQLENHFQKKLSGVTLVGQYTQQSKEKDELPTEERYTIHKVSKIPGKDKLWRFDVRMQFGTVDLTLPLPITVEWAGDTPVITLTQYQIPGLGSFSARVLFYENRYAGTWQHGDLGGHLFGKIIKNSQESTSKKDRPRPDLEQEKK